MKKVVIFDMDGTILDTLEDLYEATNYVLSYNHLPRRTLQEVRSFVGNGIYRLVELAAPPICPKPLIDLMYDDFCDYYKDHCAIHTKPYDGIVELIQNLKQKGLKVAVVSNKADFAVQELCEQYFPNLFDYAVGSKENVRKKPYPDTINEVLSYLKLSMEEAIYVGDSEVDIETAKNANMDLVICSWGFRDEDFLIEHGATSLIHKIEEINPYLGVETASWNATQYELFLDERTMPARDLVQKIQIHPQTILDLGCGPGNSTSLLKEHFPYASIIGGDISKEMLDKARNNYPDLSFIEFDGTKDFKEDQFDLIFSNACIQWIPDHTTLLTNMIKALKKDGMIAIQLPVQSENKANIIMDELANKWHLNLRVNNALSIGDYHDLLSFNTHSYSIWKTTYVHRKPSIDAIIEWFKGSSLRPYLAQLDLKQQEAFLKEYHTLLSQNYKIQKNGEVLLEFPRLFIIAQK